MAGLMLPKAAKLKAYQQIISKKSESGQIQGYTQSEVI